MLYWILLFFVGGVVCEYHFGLYKRVQNLLEYLLTLVLRILTWIWRQVTRFFRWLGRILRSLLEFLRRFLLWLLGLLPWWLLALLLVLLALVAGLGLGMWLLAGVFLFGLLAVLLLNGLWTALVVLLLALLAIFSWFADLFSGLGKWLAGLLSAFVLSIPTCTTAPSVKQEEPPAVKQEVPVVPPPATLESIMVLIQPGDGTIRATARGGYPLSLNESIDWARGKGLEVHAVRGYVHAPTLYPGDSLEYKDGRWYLHRPQ